ncbi:MAG: cytochrome c [Oligoflexia bacterium]|nr:cytochrome c [Oligoflexia bacterium]
MTVVWNASGVESSLHAWTASELIHGKHSSAHEKESETGRTSSWQGPVLSEFIKDSMKELPLAQQAMVDLVVFKNRSGASVAIPRWLLTRYPVRLATVAGAAQPSFQVVLPWGSKPGMHKENLPLKTYGITDVVRVEFSSYDQAYHPLYLHKRNDPVAMKGEKIFLQNCTSCHANSAPKNVSITDLIADQRTRQLASQGHPVIPDAPKLSDSEARALTAYLDAYRSENPSSPVSAKN